MDQGQKDALIVLSLLYYENDQNRAFKYIQQYTKAASGEKYYFIPEEGKKVLLLYLAGSAAKGDYDPEIQFVLDAVDAVSAQSILSLKPRYSIPEKDFPERNSRNYKIEDYNYYAGVHYFRSRKREEALIHLENTDDRHDAFYMRAALYAEKDEADIAVKMLGKAMDSKPGYRETILKDRIFIDFAGRNPEFKAFLDSLRPEVLPAPENSRPAE